VVLVIFILRATIRAFPKAATLTSFEEVSEAADKGDRNRALTVRLLSLLENPKPLQMPELQMDMMPGADEPGFGGLRPALNMDSAAVYVPSDHPIKVGALEFTLSDLI